jgi:hypothetical protein
MKDVTKHVGQFGQLQMKAAEDSRTPKPCGLSGVWASAPTFWSAAVLCRFVKHPMRTKGF